MINTKQVFCVITEQCKDCEERCRAYKWLVEKGEINEEGVVV